MFHKFREFFVSCPSGRADASIIKPCIPTSPQHSPAAHSRAAGVAVTPHPGPPDGTTLLVGLGGPGCWLISGRARSARNLGLVRGVLRLGAGQRPPGGALHGHQPFKVPAHLGGSPGTLSNLPGSTFPRPRPSAGEAQPVADQRHLHAARPVHTGRHQACAPATHSASTPSASTPHQRHPAGDAAGCAAAAIAATLAGTATRAAPAPARRTRPSARPACANTSPATVCA